MRQQTSWITQSFRSIGLLLFLGVFFFLSGCTSKEEEEYHGYYIFCLDTNETQVGQEKYTPKAKTTKKLVEELIQCMKKDPK